jgi:Tol biopolymer transport system component
VSATDVTRFRTTCAALLGVMALLTPRVGVRGQTPAADPAVLLQAAMHQETVNGNLDSATVLYRRVAEDRRADRVTIARALVSLGRVYEALGSEAATRTYERVIREFPDQAAIAGVARQRLATLGATIGRARAVDPVARRLWTGRQVDLSGSPSRDGKLLTFTNWNTGELAIRDLVVGASRDVTHDGDEAYAAYAEVSLWSPDGRHIAYTWHTRDRYEMRVARADGSASAGMSRPRTIYSNPQDDYLWAGDWSPDGRYLLVNVTRGDRTNEMALLSVDDGSKKVLRSFDWRSPRRMAFSPDGRWIAYDFPPAEGSPERDIYVIAADGSADTVVVRHSADEHLFGWVRDGSGIVLTTDRRGVVDLAFQRIREGRASAELQVLRADVGLIQPLGLRGSDVYYGVRISAQDVYVGELDLARDTVLVEPRKIPVRVEGHNRHPAWSPDGQQLAWLAEPATPGGALSIAIRSLRQDSERRLPIFNFLRVFQLQWSPDQKALFLLGSNHRDGYGLFRLDLATGEQKSVVTSAGSDGTIGSMQYPRMFAVSPDGRTLVYVITGDGNERPHRVVAHDLVAGSSRVLYSVRSAFETPVFSGLVVSPDGRDLVFGLIDNPPAKGTAVYVMPLAGGTARALARHDEWLTPVAWIGDGTKREILYEVDPPPEPTEEHRHQFWRVATSGGPPQRLNLSRPWLQHLRLHPDGRRFAYTHGGAAVEVWVLENVLPTRPGVRGK